MIWSNQKLLEKELEHLKNIFHKKNGYPLWMINQVMETVKKPHQHRKYFNKPIRYIRSK